jgi:hypothetical protein
MTIQGQFAKVIDPLTSVPRSYKNFQQQLLHSKAILDLRPLVSSACMTIFIFSLFYL